MTTKEKSNWVIVNPKVAIICRLIEEVRENKGININPPTEINNRSVVG